MVQNIVESMVKGMPVWVWVCLAALILLRILRFFWLATIKGWLGERLVAFALARYDRSGAWSFHDLYLPRPRGGGMTQIDHVTVSRYGVFVIETKNYKGWIFGSGKQRQWTQTIYRRKHRFQNPLHQNELHICALGEFLGLERECFHSVVFFIGGSQFKTKMPGNVLDRGLLRYLRKFREPLIDPERFEELADRLYDLDRDMDRKTLSREHRKFLAKRHKGK